MNSGIWVLLLIFITIIIAGQRKSRTAAAVIRRKHKLTTEEVFIMNEMIKSFIGKKCLIYTLNSSELGGAVTGTVTDVQDKWVILDTGYGDDMINMEYIIRIQEYPSKANKKSR